MSASSGTTTVWNPAFTSAVLKGRTFDDPLVQGIDPCLCLLHRGAHRKPANHLMVLAVARFLRTGLCIERQRREDAHVRIEEREALRQNADDEIRLVVPAAGFADDGVVRRPAWRQRYG
jgi:hypothetical protein